MGGHALAFEVETGNPDLQLRWDNTLRYNLAQRVESRDNKIGRNAISDEGTYSFDQGDIVSNRLDLLSELDFVHGGNKGFRVSAAAWYDAAYDGHGKSNPTLAAIPSYRDNEYSNYTERFYRGVSGEIMDAFAFLNFDAGDMAQLRARKQRWLDAGLKVLEIDHNWCHSIYTRDPNDNVVEFCVTTGSFTADDRARALAALTAADPEFSAPPASIELFAPR